VTYRFVPLALVALVSACADSNARFPIAAEVAAPAAAVTQMRLAVSTIEVQDVSLPAYAAASEIVIEQADGSLRVVPKAIWADDPVRGVTNALSRSLDLRSTATVVAEPWPLAEPAAVKLEVRIDQMVASVGGNFTLSGQYAIAAPEGAIRERVKRFSVSTPMTDDSAASVAKATGVAIDNLATEILTQLRR
jgi:uncharacterized protein